MFLTFNAVLNSALVWWNCFIMTEQEKEDYLYEYVDAFAEALAKLGEH